jgi:two-component SAPR family response regulator
MNGIELADAICSVHPELPVIFMSGYARALETQDLNGNRVFLSKPATLSQIDQAVNALCAKD